MDKYPSADHTASSPSSPAAPTPDSQASDFCRGTTERLITSAPSTLQTQFSTLR